MKTFKLQDIEFRVSSFSNIDPVPYCVAVGPVDDDHIAVINSQNLNPSKMLIFTREEWDAFIRGVKNNEFNF